MNVATGAEAIAGTVAATYWILMLVGRLLVAAVGAKVSMLTTGYWMLDVIKLEREFFLST